MCGLSALVSPDGTGLDAIVAMNRAVRHRGPDDEGIAVFHGTALEPSLSGAHAHGHVALGHRRLSILDLSAAGHQPMCSPDGRLWIIYNGEIYNYLELREELTKLGHAFVSQTDTEVLLTAYAQWGAACLERLAGMFAFILLDRKAGRLFCARDRFGIKPLYYCVLPAGRVAFASEIKQFMAVPGFRPSLNRQRAYDYLVWAVTDHTDETLFEGVYQLRGGDALELDIAGGRPAVRSWYNLRPEPFEGDFASAAAGFRERFNLAVGEHLRSDVPVGSCLSGGLDSSAVVGVMSRLLPGGGQHTFSARSEDPALDEGPYIEKVVRAAGAQSHEFFPHADELFETLDDLVWHQDEPFGSSSVFAQWGVFALAAQNGVKVMLDGQGSDEQLAGYRAFYGARYAELWRLRQPGELLRSMQEVKASQGLSLAWSAMMLADTLLPDSLRQAARKATGHAAAAAAPAWLDRQKLGATPADPYLPRPRSVRELSQAQLTRSNLQMLLRWEDRDSMAHSVEARVPFLDHRLVEYVLGLPSEYKVHRAVTKRVLREALRGTVPEAVLARRDKLGFVTPEERWMRAEPTRFRREIEAAVQRSNGILQPQALQLFDDMTERRRPFDYTPWRLLCFGRWLGRMEVNP